MKQQIQIRRYQPEDVRKVYEAVRESVDRLSPWMDWCRADYSMEDATYWVESRETAWNAKAAFSFLIANQHGKILGACGLNRIDHVNETANLGYWVRSSEVGRGVATAAVVWLCELAFGELNLHRLEIVASVDNDASQRVAEKAGAVREGVLRERLLVHGEYQNVILYSILKTDFQRSE